MKTREVIRQLQEADPSGELEACIGNTDIHYIERLPAFYDGPLQVVARDDRGVIVGAEVRRTGHKVSMRSITIVEAMLDKHDLPIEGPADYVKHYETVRAGLRYDRDGETVAAENLAAELLGLGTGCHDGSCVLGGPGRRPGAMHTARASASTTNRVASGAGH